jgi:hypothetical protein
MKSPTDDTKTTSQLPQGKGGNITCEDGYVLAEGSEILLEIIQQNQKEGISQPPAVKLWLRFPSGDYMMLIERMNVPIPEGDAQSWEWYHLLESDGKQAETLAALTKVQIRDTPGKDYNVDFICEIDLSSISDAPGKHTSTHTTSLRGMHIVGFFVTGSGRNAIAPPGIPPWDLVDCDGANSTEVESFHQPA